MNQYQFSGSITSHLMIFNFSGIKDLFVRIKKLDPLKFLPPCLLPSENPFASSSIPSRIFPRLSNFSSGSISVLIPFWGLKKRGKNLLILQENPNNLQNYSKIQRDFTNGRNNPLVSHLHNIIIHSISQYICPWIFGRQFFNLLKILSIGWIKCETMILSNLLKYFDKFNEIINKSN
jgi:hypothetical protein